MSRLLDIAEYEDFLDKVHGHNDNVRNQAIDEFVEFCLDIHRKTGEPLKLRKLAAEFKEQKQKP